MGKRAARNIWAFDSFAEFENEGGAIDYGEGYVDIAGKLYRCDGVGLKKLLTADISAICRAFRAGRKTWPVGGPNAIWGKRYSRIPQNWVANATVAVGERKIIAHAGSANQFDQSSSTDATQFWVLTCSIAGQTGGSRPNVTAAGAAIVDGNVTWISSPVIYMTVAGTGTAAGTSAANSRAIGVVNNPSALVLFRTGQTFPQTTFFNYYVGAIINLVAAGAVIPLTFSWFGAFSAGLPIIEKIQWLCDGFEAFQIEFGGATASSCALNGKNQRYSGCKFTGVGSNVATATLTTVQNYGYLIFDDCEFKNHVGGNVYGYDGLNITLGSGASINWLVFRNCDFSGNGRHGLYLHTGTATNYTDAAASPIGYYEQINNKFSGNGATGWVLQNPAAFGNYLNRIKKFRIENNEYVGNGTMGATFEGFGHEDYRYYGIIRQEKATDNMFSASSAGTGNYQPCGLHYAIVEEGVFTGASSGGNSFDGVNLYFDVIATGDAYSTESGPVGNIVRHNITDDAIGKRWFADDRFLVADWNSSPPSAGIALLRGLDNIVYGNNGSGNATGIWTLGCARTRVYSNKFSSNDIGIFVARDGGTNEWFDNECHNNYIGMAQENNRTQDVSTISFVLSATAFRNVKSVTASAACPLFGVYYLAEKNGPGLGFISGYGSANTAVCNILELVKFSKSDYAAGELEVFAHKNLRTNPKASGSIQNNDVAYSYGSDVNTTGGNTWPDGFADKANYANGLINHI